MPLFFYSTIAVFVLTYAIIISEKFHRTVVALAGAILMILLGIISQEQAIEGIDFNTLGLLIGMMIVVGIARQSGMFQAVALYLAQKAKGRPIPIFILLGLTVAIFSALLDNVTTVLLMVPVTFVIANNLKISPYPFLISAILMSNVGGMATLIGDPPNIMIGSAANLTFNDFLINLAPISIIIMVVTMGGLYLWYKRELVTTKEAQAAIMKFNPKDALTDMPLLRHSLIVLAIVLLGFIMHGSTGLEGATIALGGAALLLLLSLHDPHDHLREIEWTTIFFFIGLFVLVTGLEHSGAIRMLAEQLLVATAGSPTAMTLTILWGSAILSAIVDNIPFVATMIPLIHDIGSLSGIALAPLWWALAIGADIGGNATLIGASANVVVGGMAEKEGTKIGFFSYMKVALPMTLVALIISSVYMWVRYL
ncbi:MAG: hypothetical protein COU35_03150 [Candidatus Magasanikbacteria bacterium CG10_big_fil_rev_8_21_14_0_10_47_10]|uniref:Citrate transporter-like domain-containing protein n=1 Tax=Candidatus Magasanikbacteria bacterium CG10_big_fil_rev_8_21_14_0_10_47_10 TaxID=1974652 RepID=A0A2H0TQ55_9BACT|nr:MAG: hypothetical protein COU35_03150 [Candidatus Magasanikbacteria bacterium CG10_big_fil_rev_8_21_14_0_10_47_10]